MTHPHHQVRGFTIICTLIRFFKLVCFRKFISQLELRTTEAGILKIFLNVNSARLFVSGMQQEFRKSGISTGFRESCKIRNPKSGKKLNPEHRHIMC